VCTPSYLYLQYIAAMMDGHGGLSLRQVLDIAIDVLEGLSYLHAVGVMHRYRFRSLDLRARLHVLTTRWFHFHLHCILCQHDLAVVGSGRYCRTVHVYMLIRSVWCSLCRDLKPSNVVLCSRDRSRPMFKLCDVGCSTHADGAVSAVGAPAYRAPEVRARGKH
jgi:serine/threonine protein kinase